MQTPNIYPKVKTPGGMTLAFELVDAAVQLTVCRSASSTHRSQKELLRTVNVSALLIEGIYCEIDEKKATRVVPDATIVDNLKINSTTACVLIWNFPAAGIVVTACCAKPAGAHDTRQKDALSQLDLSAMLIEHFFES